MIEIYLKVIKDILNITEAENMLEIGFNIGYSASMWLEFDVNKSLKLTSRRHRKTRRH